MFKQLTATRSNTCWAHAIAITLGCSYDKALFLGRKLLLKKGMDYSKGMLFRDIVSLASEMRGKELKFYSGNCGTLKKFLKANPRGKFIVCSMYHAMAVVDGVVYDFKMTMNYKIVQWVLVG